MSHFPVLVIGDDPVKQLAPYHEFECTGYDDEFVQDVDETEDYRERYESETRRMLVSPDGERLDYYDERFYTKIPTEGERIAAAYKPGEKFHEIPEGWVETEVPTRDLMTFTEWVRREDDDDGERPWELRPGEERTEAHKYRYVELDENDEVVRVVRRTNPDKKWDWWQLGGRFSRFFKLKPDVEMDLDHVGGGDLYTKESAISSIGSDEYYESDHCKRERARWVAQLVEAHSTDHAQAKDIDFDATRARAEARARENFAKWRAIYEEHGKPLPFEHFLEIRDAAVERLKEQGIADEQVTSLYEHHKYKVTRERQEHERAQMAYNAQPAIKAESEAHLTSWRTSPMEHFGYDEEDYVRRMRDKSMVPYAVVKDGKWYAKGEMGWFAFSDDHMTDEEWCAKVHEMYDELDPDTWLTLVDCHI